MNLRHRSFHPVGPIEKFHQLELGINLRQHFAGLAMQGMLAAGAGMAKKPESTAAFAVEYADALLAELSKPQA